jgi:hypothetical protein
MHTISDIRAQVEADAMLQREISSVLLAVADSLGTGSDNRVVRILTRTLEASWDEHVGFQDAVIFPIVVGRHGPRVMEIIDRRRSEHATLAQQHSQIRQHLAGELAQGGRLAEELEALLRDAYAQRQSHLDCDADLDGWLPETFSEAECALCGKWWTLRSNLPFPLNLLRHSVRPRPGWLH